MTLRNYQQSDSEQSDSERYGKRLHNYLLALNDIDLSMDEISICTTINSEQVIGGQYNQYIELLQILKNAFSTELFFIGNSEQILFYRKGDKPEYIISNTNALFEKIKKKNHLLFNKLDNDWPYSQKMRDHNITSFMAIYINKVDQVVGFCNGKNEVLPYLNEDLMFFKSVFSLISYAKQQEKKRMSLERYFLAKLEGNWDFLLRSSEDCILSRAINKSTKYQKLTKSR